MSNLLVTILVTSLNQYLIVIPPDTFSLLDQIS